MKLEAYYAAVRAERDSPTPEAVEAVKTAFADMCWPVEGIDPWWFIGASIEYCGDEVEAAVDLENLTEQQAEAFDAGMNEMGEGPMDFDWQRFFEGALP